jgi:hypothetical protein
MVQFGLIAVIKLKIIVGVIKIKGRWMGDDRFEFGVIATKYENITSVPLI